MGLGRRWHRWMDGKLGGTMNNRKRKRSNENTTTTTQVMVIVNSQRETEHYYLREASKPQLLRLRRDQLVQLIHSSWLSAHHRHANDLQDIQHKNKDALAAFILDARAKRHNYILFPSKSQSNLASCCQLDQDENPSSQGSSSQPLNIVRTRVKSLPGRKLSMDPSQSSRQNRTCTRSRFKNLNLSNNPQEPDSLPTGTRKTRSATQAEEVAEKTQPFFQRYSSNSNSKSSWRSSPSAAAEELVHDQSITQTSIRLRNRRKTVKFIGQKLIGQTPIAYRTRRSSVHRTPSITIRNSASKNIRTSSRTRRRITISPNKRDTSTSLIKRRVITPTTRKLRNGKVILWMKQPNLSQTKRDRASCSGQEESISIEQDQTESPDEDGQSSHQDESIHSVQDSDISIVSPGQASHHSLTDGEVGDQTEPDETGSIVCDSEQEEGADDELIDLSQATSKRLLRLKRENLVKLCTERELEAEGTKKDLVQNLLIWRDTNDVISPSSDPCQRSSGPSADSEQEDAEESATSREIHSVQKPPDGTCSRPIILDSDYDDEPKADQQKKMTKTTNGLTTATKKDDVGELLDLESLNLQDKEIHYDQLKKLEKIGSGGFKDVYKGLYRRIPVAIAEFRGHLTEMDRKELRILRDLRHENIVRFIGVSVPGESNSSYNASNNLNQGVSEVVKQVPIMIITELCTNGDLFDYIRRKSSTQHSSPPKLQKILLIFKDICKGLHYLHSHQPKIIHRDLKSSNVLITSRGVAKLNDFGLARIKNSTRSLVRSLVGTVNWQAPELWVPHPRYNEKVDVYSAGLVLWEMLQWHQPIKKYPFEGQNEHAIYHDVGQKLLRPSVKGMRKQWGNQPVDLVEKLWSQNPVDRPDMLHVLLDLDQIIHSL